MNTNSAKQIKCPQCGRLSLYSVDNPFRPFCSERCRILDLGAWADGSYSIPDNQSSSDSLSSDEDGYSDDDSET